MIRNEILERFGRAFVPLRAREPLRNYLLKAGYQNVPYSAFGLFFIITLITTYLLFFAAILPALQETTQAWLFIITLGFWIASLLVQNALIMFFIWSYLNLKIYGRIKEIEDKLPDYLELVITNLRSGMSFDKSLFGAIRPEFGVLSAEIGMVSKRVMTGNDTAAALQEFSDRYESPILRRGLELIISELDSGGEIADVIERVIDNLRKTKRLKDEMRSSVISYMMFISIIVMALSPVLFALAHTILSVILSFAGQIGSAPAGGVGAAASLFDNLEALAAQEEMLLIGFKNFSYAALTTISLFAGMIVSIIEKGDIRGGIKYIPIFIAVTLTLYTLALGVVGGVFGGIV
ncbi:MAG: type II secretion system F family protein [Candidatus Woesearchaeota archaeon]